MNNIKIKICGLTTESAVEAVIAARADYAGFVHFPGSPRHVEIARAAALAALLPVSTQAVSVLVDPDDVLLKQIATLVKPWALQLHGNESPERVRAIKQAFPVLKIIKAIAVQTGDDVARANAYIESADMLLFDARAPHFRPPLEGGQNFRKEIQGGYGKKSSATPPDSLRESAPPQGGGEEDYLPGGNGLSFDWILLKNRDFDKSWFLSGGLNADNVADAIAMSGAKMVDVSSGVETAPGVKDSGLIQSFVKAART